jgi:hypothetical protein
MPTKPGPKPGVYAAACALALSCGEYESERAAKLALGVPYSTSLVKFDLAPAARATALSTWRGAGAPNLAAGSQDMPDTRESLVLLIEKKKRELAALFNQLHELPCDPTRPPSCLRTLLAQREAQRASCGYTNVYADRRLQRREVLGMPGVTLKSTAMALSEQLTPLMDGARAALVGLCHVDRLPDVLLVYENQRRSSPTWHCCVCRPVCSTFEPCGNEHCTAMLSSTDAIIFYQDPWDDDGQGILACIPAPWICQRMHEQCKRAQHGIDWAEHLCKGLDDSTLKGIRRTSGQSQTWKCAAASLERNQDIGLANDQGLSCRDNWESSVMNDTFNKALAKGGSPEQLLAVPPRLQSAGAAVAVQPVYAAHRDQAVRRGGPWAALDASGMPKVRIGSAVNKGVSVRLPAWRNEGIVDGTNDAELAGAAIFAATVQAGTEDLMCRFGALPFVHRLRHRQTVLAFAEDSLAMRAATAVETERLERRARGQQAMSDDEELRMAMSRFPPFSIAKDWLLSKSSVGFGRSDTGTKGVHDDKNAARYATAHRTLSEPASGAKVALEICMNGKVIRVPSVRAQLVLWYAWLPHRTVQTESGRNEYVTRGKRLPFSVTPDERMHCSTYDRLRVERAIEVMEHAWKQAAGQPSANALLTTCYSLEQDSESDAE